MSSFLPSCNKSADFTDEQISADLGIIESHWEVNPDTAIALATELLKKSKESGSLFGITRAGYWIAHLLKQKEEFGESVTYYLEAIRQSERAVYDGHIADKIHMRRNLANTFRKHEAHELATRYNLEAIELAKEHDILEQVVSLTKNQGLVYQREGQDYKAIACYKEVIQLSDSIEYDSDLHRYWSWNAIGVVYKKNGTYDSALTYFNKLLNVTDSTYLIQKAHAIHNIGTIHYEYGDVFKTIELIRESLEILESIEQVDELSLFTAYNILGRYLVETSQIEEAVAMLSRAETLVSYVEWDSYSFSVYKSLSDLYYMKGEEKLGAAYLKIYNKETEAYHGVEKENLELIAYRFYEKVEKEERIASIMFYAKLVGGILLGGFMLVGAYTRVRSVRVRRSKEALKHDKMVSDLKALKAQINPHFLFNSLNSIQSFILEGEESLADDYLVKYGKLMRMILNHSNELTVCIDEEIEALKLYVELEQLRLDKPLNFEVKVADEIDTEYTRIPSMVIQPLVENAIWHGMQPKDAEGELMLEITQNNHWICVVLTDNGVGFDVERKGENRPHGLQLAQERINIFNEVNGVEAVFHVTSSPEGTRIEFNFPEDL